MRYLTDDLRKPYQLPPLHMIFKPRLKQGDVIQVEIAFFLPPGWQTEHIKSRLISQVGAALSKDFSQREGLPTFDELLAVVEPPVDLLIAEKDIPVLYAEVIDRHNSRSTPSQDVEIGSIIL